MKNSLRHIAIEKENIIFKNIALVSCVLFFIACVEPEYILGRFTAAGTPKKSVFIDLTNLQGNIECPEVFFLESENNPISPGTPPVYYYPCIESFYSTAIKPGDWPN